jgi:dTDP-4-amino-4,6-dideoxygalactose transaminase
MWSRKDHGKSWEAMYEREHAPGFRWVHESFGSNWRMLEMQAAIGRLQLRKMPLWLVRRQANARRLAETCRRFNAMRVPRAPADVEDACYRFYAFVEPEKLRRGWSRDRIVREINALGVPCYHGSCPEVYLEKSFDGTGYRPQRRLPVARELGETSLMFLVHPTLTAAEIDRSCAVLEEVLGLASIGEDSAAIGHVRSA